jgi:hypothetical protein
MVTALSLSVTLTGGGGGVGGGVGVVLLPPQASKLINSNAAIEQESTVFMEFSVREAELSFSFFLA